MNDIAVFASPLPFSNKQIKAHAVAGSTVREIIDLVCPPQLTESGIGAVVQIDGRIIAQEKWHRITPKEGSIVNVRIVPQGGGKKNPLATLLSIAVLVAAPMAGAAFGSTLGLSVLGSGVLTAGQTAFFNGLVSAAVGVVGSLLTSALAPPPKPSNAGQINNPAQSPTQFIEGARNSINPFGVIPICLGVNRMFPLQAAVPYTLVQGGDQYVRQLFTYGYGDKLSISEMKIGETPLSEFEDIDLKHRIDGNLHLPTGLYSSDVAQDEYSILLRYEDGFTLRTTRANVDEAIIDVTFPQGLCEFNDEGKRISRRVQMELQYSPAGLNDWSAGAVSFKPFGGATLLVDPVLPYKSPSGDVIGYRRDLVVLDIASGERSIVKGTASSYLSTVAAPPLPTDKIRLSTLLVRSRLVSMVFVTQIVSYTDDRQSSLFGVRFQTKADFKVSASGSTVTIASGSLAFANMDYNASQSEALRKSVRIQFPETGTYDIRIRRRSQDTDDDQIFDKVYLTSIKSIRHQAPVKLQGINGTAIRIRATDQLNGTLDQFNAIVGNAIPDYVAATGTWEIAVTSNPASLYRYVLQGPANDRPLADSKIDLAALEAWHTHCAEQGYSCNIVIDYETSVDEVLRLVASAGAASPAIIDGKRTVVVDMLKDDIVQVITPRNSWGYSGKMLYPDMPHAFRVQFRNAAKGYVRDERIVYDDGYDENNAFKFESLELPYCTNSALAFNAARRHIAEARLRPEEHSFMMDVENLVALRGDRIKFAHDVPLVGVGDGRIKKLVLAGELISQIMDGEDQVFVGASPVVTVTDPYLVSDEVADGEDLVYEEDDQVLISLPTTNVIGFTLDDTVSIPTGSTYYVRVRLSDGTWLYRQIEASVGEAQTFFFTESFSLEDIPLGVGDLGYIVEAGGELDLIITRIEPQDDLSARITAIDYAPAIFTAESAPIPSFKSNITTPLEFLRPAAPVLIGAQSDELVMLRNSDGSFTPRAVFTLRNDNEGDISTWVKIRRSGTLPFTSANVLEATPDRLVLTGMEDGTSYDIHIRYQRRGSSVLSAPLQLNNFKFIGASGVPRDVTGLTITVSGETALFKWPANDDIDLSHYRIKFSSVFTGATWGTAQLLEDRIYENRVTLPFQPGTYLIKAVDLSGNESATATAVITYDPGVVANAVERIEEHPSFSGTKDNVVGDVDGIVLGQESLGDGYYYFANSIDLTGLYTCFVSASIVANGVFFNNLFEMDDIFAEDDIFGGGTHNIFDIADIFAEDDIFGIGPDAWSVQLQYRTTAVDPEDGLWSEWQEFAAGTIEFYAAQFRLRMSSLSKNVTPRVSLLSVTVDMPDRIERGEDLAVTAGEGATVTYPVAFKNNPAVSVTIQDADAADEIVFISKTSGGFSIKVYNRVTMAYVDRTFDFIASGYGRKK